LPVFGWASLSGRRSPPTATLLDLPGMHYTTSGRASILLALETLGIGAGDRVLLPTYHCPTMAAPAAERGVAITFYPIDSRGSPDLAWLNAQDMDCVRAILVAHFFGLPQPMAEMRRWCDARGIALIEDCAHALFGRSDGRGIGAWGDIAIGSLTKFLPVPEGGCLVVNKHGTAPTLSPCDFTTEVKAAVDILEESARHGRLSGLNAAVAHPLFALRRLRGNRVPLAPAPNDATPSDMTIDVPLAHRALSRPSRWVAMRLPRERIVQRRRQRYAELAERLSGHAGLRPLRPELPADCAPYVMPLWVAAPDPGYAELRSLGMPVFRWDRLWPGTPTIEGDQGLDWSHHVLQLACHQDLADAELTLFVDTLLRLYATARTPVTRTASQQPTDPPFT
jgi:dTDP-4-amino-4,6-dideoxygalactose transaminase